MAERLARIFGTEEDRVNCPFYFKIGACRHGDQCSRQHNRPVASQCLLIPHMYQQPPAAVAMAEGQDVPDEVADEAQQHFEQFFEEVFMELCNFGQIEDMACVDNVSDHLIGNVYVRFSTEEEAARCMQKLSGRYYAGRLLAPELSPLTDFKEARCRQYDDAQCARGGYCNFIHWKHVPRKVKKRLFREMFDEHPEYQEGGRDDRGRDRDRDRDRGRDRDRDRDRDRRKRSRSRDRDRDDRRKGGGAGGGGGGGGEPLPDLPPGLPPGCLVPRLDHSSPFGGGGRPEEAAAIPARQTSDERRAMIESWNQAAGR
eukprot:CAMPEP_0204506512 /NCGR_PEP_ID=MMETSP0471-20130131/109289_1 /ASSEMBLY_ACC=CAM_ASM_000602 /TAXON_ID=2969 /ORGANISM="Oxyrrhis marina" /LENGTH=313 /DNA_ID=CAMNT_0051511517 /DNA_START=67 /DNA_END=1008 /DNA_ORIENTATION=-